MTSSIAKKKNEIKQLLCGTDSWRPSRSDWGKQFQGAACFYSGQGSLSLSLRLWRNKAKQSSQSLTGWAAMWKKQSFVRYRLPFTSQQGGLVIVFRLPQTDAAFCFIEKHESNRLKCVIDFKIKKRGMELKFNDWIRIKHQGGLVCGMYPLR